MPRRGLSIEHTKAFLDVVLGVVIALPLAALPSIVIKVISAYEQGRLIALLMLIPALIFSAFYWLEARRFIEDEMRCKNALKAVLEKSPEHAKLITEHKLMTETLTLERFGGSVIVISLVAAILKFAEEGLFRPFVVANLIFWMLDFLNNIIGNRKKRWWGKFVDSFPPAMNEERGWYRAHYQSYNFFDYSIVNAFFFLALLQLDYVVNRSHSYRVGASIFILIFTIIRHLFWRVHIDYEVEGVTANLTTHSTRPRIAS
jgi:hypothetical protein